VALVANTNMCLWEMEPTDISDNGHEEIERNWAFLINCIDDVGVYVLFYFYIYTVSFFSKCICEIKERTGEKKSPYGSIERSGVWVAGVYVWEWEPEAPFPAAILTFLFFLYLPLFCGSSFSFHPSYGCWFCRLLVFERLLSMNLRARKRLRGEKD